MKETRAALLLRTVALLAVLTLIVGGVFGRGVLSSNPGNPTDIFAQIAGGLGDGFMGLVVVVVLAAPPLAMLTVAAEGRAKQPRHFWIALATTGVLIVSALIAASN